MTTITESVVEEAALGWLSELGWHVGHGLEPTSSGAVVILRSMLLLGLVSGEVRVGS